MELHEIIKPAEIEAAVKGLALRIDKDYKGKKPVVIGVLKGSFIFLSDLVRELALDLSVDFIVAGSYGSGTEPAGDVVIKKDIDLDIEGKSVIIVDDILDTGHTLDFIVRHLKGKNPEDIRTCVLLDKPSRRSVDVKVDYVGLEVQDRFLVGYGLDFSERYRNLDGLFEIRRRPPAVS